MKSILQMSSTGCLLAFVFFSPHLQATILAQLWQDWAHLAVNIHTFMILESNLMKCYQNGKILYSKLFPCFLLKIGRKQDPWDTPEVTLH